MTFSVKIRQHAREQEKNNTIVSHQRRTNGWQSYENCSMMMMLAAWKVYTAMFKRFKYKIYFLLKLYKMKDFSLYFTLFQMFDTFSRHYF